MIKSYFLQFGIIIGLGLIVTAFALAATEEKSHSLKNGTTSFTIKVKHPKRAILFPESINVTTSYSTVCLKGTTVSHLSRTFTTPFTRNLLWEIPPRQDVCYITIAAATKKDIGQIVVDITTYD